MTIIDEESPRLFVTRYFWPELIGSAPFASDIAGELARHGAPTTVLSGLPHYPGSDVFPAYGDGRRMREFLGAVLVERLRLGPPRRQTARGRITNEVEFFLRGMLSLATGRIPRHPLVLALCPSILCVALGLAARRRRGVCVAIVHDIQSGLAEGLGMGGRALGTVMRTVERAILNRVDLAIVLSTQMEAQLRRIGVTAPIDVVPLWVDTDRIRVHEPDPHDTIKVLYSGNLGRKQGLGQVVDMAEHLAIRRPDIEIILRGNGNQIASLTGEIARRGLGNVRLTELRPHDDLSAALAVGDIHLVPQSPQAADFAVPSKIYNIMAVGRPFVATALPGSTLWQLQKQSGAFLCVPPGEPGEFAEAIARLADDATLRHDLGLRGRRFVEEHFSKRAVLGALMGRLDALAAH
jgi:colanic acid biosynthesis glycosyl transferase WcaI